MPTSEPGAQHRRAREASPSGNPLGAIHNAPRTWSDGRRQNLYIRFERLEDVAPEIRDVIVHEHVIVVAGLGLDEQAMRRAEPMGYRVHQWSKRDAGVVGRGSAVGTRKPQTHADGPGARRRQYDAASSSMNA